MPSKPARSRDLRISFPFKKLKRDKIKSSKKAKATGVPEINNDKNHMVINFYGKYLSLKYPSFLIEYGASQGLRTFFVPKALLSIGIG